MKPTALLISDLHARDDQPVCRIDNFLNTQREIFLDIKYQCEVESIPCLVAGDIFHKWKASPNLLRLMIETLPFMVVIPGQHDLPRHSMELYHQSGLAVLEAAGKAKVLYDGGVFTNDEIIVRGFAYGEKPNNYKRRRNDKRKRVCLIHDLITKSEDPFPDANATKAKSLLKELNSYDLILTGDNHQQFTEEYKGGLLVNCGSATRQRTSETHQPGIYLWNADNNSVKKIEVDCDKEAVSQDHIEIQKKKDERIDEYIDAMNVDYSLKLDFKANINEHMRSNKTDRETKRIVLECME